MPTIDVTDIVGIDKLMEEDMTEKIYSYTDVCHLANGWNSTVADTSISCMYVAVNCKDVYGPYINKYEWIDNCWQHIKKIYPKDVM